jgi:hypothetical protein
MVCGTVAAQNQPLSLTPSWLLDSKRVSMHHSLNFSYGSHVGSYQSLYANSIQYELSPKLTLSGTFGYYQYGVKYRSFKSMLHGFGLTYNPNKYFRLHIEYRGLSPISGPDVSGN